MKKILLFLICIPLFAQSQNNIKKPKLIIGIVVDQMRFDYIQRFWNNFSEEGFKKLINQGHFFQKYSFWICTNIYRPWTCKYLYGDHTINAWNYCK